MTGTPAILDGEVPRNLNCHREHLDEVAKVIIHLEDKLCMCTATSSYPLMPAPFVSHKKIHTHVAAVALHASFGYSSIVQRSE